MSLATQLTPHFSPRWFYFLGWMALSIFVLPTAHAQGSQTEANGSPPDLRFGVRIGPNFGSFNGLQLRGSGAAFFTVEDGARTGLAVGGYAIIPLASPLSLQPEVMYIQKGARIEVTGLTTAGGVFRVGYLEVPFLLRFDIPIDQSTQGLQIQPYVVGGPTVGLKLHANSEATGSFVASQSFDDFTRAYDLGLTAGAGAGYGTDFGTAVAEIRYALGVSDIASSSQESIRTRGIMITVGLVF